MKKVTKKETIQVVYYDFIIFIIINHDDALWCDAIFNMPCTWIEVIWVLTGLKW